MCRLIWEPLSWILRSCLRQEEQTPTEPNQNAVSPPCKHFGSFFIQNNEKIKIKISLQRNLASPGVNVSAPLPVWVAGYLKATSVARQLDEGQRCVMGTWEEEDTPPAPAPSHHLAPMEESCGAVPALTEPTAANAHVGRHHYTCRRHAIR